MDGTGWWKKSCTTWDVQNPVKNGTNYQPHLVSRISAINSMGKSKELILTPLRNSPPQQFQWEPEPSQNRQVVSPVAIFSRDNVKEPKGSHREPQGKP